MTLSAYFRIFVLLKLCCCCRRLHLPGQKNCFGAGVGGGGGEEKQSGLCTKVTT